MKTKNLLIVTLLLIAVAGWGQENKNKTVTDPIQEEITRIEKETKTMEENVKAQKKAQKAKIDDLKKAIESRNKTDLKLLESLEALSGEENQTQDEKKDIETTPKKESETPTNNQNMYGIAFVVGLGGVAGFKRYYQMPVIDPVDKKVKLDQAQPSGLNASIGIVYSPYYNSTKSIGDIQRGLSFAAFFNPLNIVSSSSNIQNTFSIENFGVGAGWKTLSGLSFFLTMEAFSIKQPRQWFITKYQNNDSPYILQVDGQPQTQTSIDVNDNNIFEKKYILGIGIKICYTFDIVKSINQN